MSRGEHLKEIFLNFNLCFFSTSSCVVAVAEPNAIPHVVGAP